MHVTAGWGSEADQLTHFQRTGRNVWDTAAPAATAAPPNPAGPPPGGNTEGQLRAAWQNASGPPPFTGGPTVQQAPPAAPSYDQARAGFQELAGRQGPGEFRHQGQYGAAPTFVPGANPFQMPQGGPTQAPAAQARGQFSAPQHAPIDQALVRQLFAGLENPSAYNADVVQQTFGRLAGSIDDDYALARKRTDEEMARRGIYDSTIAGGRLHDLNIGQRSARTELAGQLLTDQARTYGADRATAIAAAMGYGGQQFEHALAGFGANQAAGQQAFGQQAASAQLADQFRTSHLGDQLAVGGFNQGLAQQKFGNEMASSQFNAGEQARRYGESLGGYQANLAGNAQGFDQRAAALASLMGVDTQRFQNDFAGRQFGAAEDQRRVGNQHAAYQANLAGNQQGFNQQQQHLQNYLGYGQQAFQNQMSAAQLNNTYEQQQLQMLLQLFGLT
jgi:hypothetical protein